MIVASPARKVLVVVHSRAGATLTADSRPRGPERPPDSCTNSTIAILVASANTKTQAKKREIAEKNGKR
jgi:hypothetical protein